MSHSVVLPLAVTYCAIFLATSALAKPPGLPGGDYSYGISSMEASQMVLYTMPEPYPGELNLIWLLPVTFTLAIASWYIVGKAGARSPEKTSATPRRRTGIQHPESV